MAKLPSFQFYPGDWMKDPDLRRCSRGARGMWIDMLCLMFECSTRGVLAGTEPWSDEDIAAAVGGDIGEGCLHIAELLRKGVARRNSSGAIFSMRMVRDEQIRQERVRSGLMRGKQNRSKTEAKRKRKHKQRPPPSSSSSSSSSKEPPPPFSFPSALDCERFMVAWKRWEKYRTEKDSPIVETEREGTLTMLAEMGLERAIDAIWHTIAKGWHGIREAEAKANGRLKHKTDSDAVDYLRTNKQVPEGCYLGVELNDKLVSLGFDGLSQSEQRIAIDKCRRALEHPR